MTLLPWFRPPPHPILTAVRQRPSLDLTYTGLTYGTLMFFIGAAAINTQVSLLFGVFGLMIGIAVVTFLIGMVGLRKLRVDRELPEAGVVGVPMSIGYRIVNQKSFWPSFSLFLTELDGVEGFTRQPRGYVLHVAGGQEVMIPVEVTPKRRGVHELDRHQFSTSFPFGFMKRATERRHKDRVVVYPPVADVDPRVLARCQPAENVGPNMRPRRGGDDEVYGLKEYRRGENPRLISWRHTARTGTLIVREMTRVAPPRLLILVDTFLPDRARKSHETVERAVAMAASVASYALGQGLSVGVHGYVGNERGEFAGIAPAHGKRQLRDVMTFLARLPLNTVVGPQTMLEVGRNLAEQNTTAVLCTGGVTSPGRPDFRRRPVVVLSTADSSIASWFKYPPGILFDRSFPPEQEAGIE